jgi:hypothetical protein
MDFLEKLAKLGKSSTGGAKKNFTRPAREVEVIRQNTPPDERYVDDAEDAAQGHQVRFTYLTGETYLNTNALVGRRLSPGIAMQSALAG